MVSNPVLFATLIALFLGIGVLLNWEKFSMRLVILRDILRKRARFADLRDPRQYRERRKQLAAEGLARFLDSPLMRAFSHEIEGKQGQVVLVLCELDDPEMAYTLDFGTRRIERVHAQFHFGVSPMELVETICEEHRNIEPVAWARKVIFHAKHTISQASTVPMFGA